MSIAEENIHHSRAAYLQTLARNMTMEQVRMILGVGKKELVRLSHQYGLRWQSTFLKRIISIVQETDDPVLKGHFIRTLLNQTSYEKALRDKTIQRRIRAHNKRMREKKFVDSLFA